MHQNPLRPFKDMHSYSPCLDESNSGECDDELHVDCCRWSLRLSLDRDAVGPFNRLELQRRPASPFSATSTPMKSAMFLKCQDYVARHNSLSFLSPLSPLSSLRAVATPVSWTTASTW